MQNQKKRITARTGLALSLGLLIVVVVSHSWTQLNSTQLVLNPEKVPSNQEGETTSPKTEPTIAELHAATSRAFAEGKYVEAWTSIEALCRIKPGETSFQFLNGEIAFANGRMAKSVAAFDEVIRLSPQLEPQLWQRGLALYYANQFADGVKQLETHQTINSQDVENAVWHLLCAARISDIAQARKNLIPIERDHRVPMAEVYEMFAGRALADDVLRAANRTSPAAPKGSTRHDLQLYYAHLYIGLFEEMKGNKPESLQAMKKAVAINPLSKNNFMGRVADVHVKLRQTNPEPIPAAKN